jgi:hypothetical protein
VSKKNVFIIVICLLFMAGAYRTLPAAAPQFEPRGRSQAEQEMLDRQAKEANKKRQQDIKDETERLFQLATELKAAVDKSNENMLSLEVVRKAEEVEKLAKHVKEKMKEAVGPPLRTEPPPRIIPPPLR